MALREILAKFGFEVDSSKLDKAKKGTDAVAEGVKALVGLLVAKQLIGGIKSFVSEMQDMNSQLGNTSEALGISYDDLQRWTFAAKFADVSAEQLATSLKFLQKNVAEAAEKGGESAKVFKDLGVDIKDASGQIRPTSELMREAGIAVAGMKTPAERTAAVLKIFGKQGLALIPMFSQGAEGLDKLLKRFDELGGGIGPDAAEALSKSETATKELDFAWLSLKSRLVVALLPAFTALVETGTKLVVSFQDMAKNSHVFQAALIVLGGVASVVAIGMYAKFLPMILGIALLILLVDDLITAFDGGDSVIGKFLDKVLGDGKGSKDRSTIFGMMKDDIANFKKETEGLDFADTLDKAFDDILIRIGKFLASDIPEAWSYFWKSSSDGVGGAGEGGKFLDQISSQLNYYYDYIVAWAEDAANSMIDGLVNGITSGVGAVVDAVKGLAKSVKDEFFSVFKIGSPSKLIKYDIAGNLNTTFVDTVKAGGRAIREAVRSSYGGAMDQLDMPSVSYAPSFGGSGGGGPSSKQTSIQQQNTYQVTIQGSGNTASDVRTGVSMANDESRRELLYALEPVAEG